MWGVRRYSCVMQQKWAVALIHDELVHLVRQLMTDDRADPLGPTFAQHSMLSFVDRRPGCRATEIAESFGVHRSTVSRQLRVCLERGWVSAESGPARAGHPLHLTSLGRDVLLAAEAARVAETAERTRDWSTAELDQFASLLHRFIEPHADTDDNNPGGEPNA